MSSPLTNDQSSRVATVSAVLIDRFGERAMEVAERQAEVAAGGTDLMWAAIVAHLSMLSTLDALGN